MSVEVISNGDTSVLTDNTTDVAFGPVMEASADVVYDFLSKLDNDARLYSIEDLTSEWVKYWDRVALDDAWEWEDEEE